MFCVLLYTGNCIKFKVSHGLCYVTWLSWHYVDKQPQCPQITNFWWWSNQVDVTYLFTETPAEFVCFPFTRHR